MFLPRHLRAAAAFVVFLAVSMPVAFAQAQNGRDEHGGSGFSLVAQALRARLRLVYLARQDIFWSTSPPMGTAQVVADIAHAGGRTSITYRFPLEAAGRVSLDDGVRSWLYDSSHRALIVGQSAADDRSAASPTTLALLRRNYDCLRLSRESLNGWPCDVVAIRPRALGGPSKLLWIDTARHAILRTEEYDAQGCRCYVSFYEAIRFLPVLPANAFSLPAQSRSSVTQRVNVQTLEDISAPQAFAAAHLVGCLPAWCPCGFTLTRCSVVGSHAGSKTVLLHYSDGLKSLLVIEEARSGAHPTAPELNEALARYGQQVWVREEGSLRMVVRGDTSLPGSLGAEILRALSGRADGVLSRGLARDFGTPAAKLGVVLRRQGWGYEQIGALCLWEKNHPHLRTRIKPLLDESASWFRFADAFGDEAGPLVDHARAWVSSTLALAH